MTLTPLEHASHRNGISGVPFDVVRFHDPQAGPMLGVVFPEPGCVAVLNLDQLAAGDIAFGSNSWRGDRYEPTLRRLVAAAPGREDGEPDAEGPLPAEADELAALLRRRRQIAQVWGVEEARRCGGWPASSAVRSHAYALYETELRVRHTPCSPSDGQPDGRQAF